MYDKGKKKFEIGLTDEDRVILENYASELNMRRSEFVTFLLHAYQRKRKLFMEREE